MPRIICTLVFAFAFTLHSIAQLAPPPDQEFVYLGEHCELIVPLPNSARPVSSALTVVRKDDSVVLSDYVGNALIASIKNNGEVTFPTPFDGKKKSQPQTTQSAQRNSLLNRQDRTSRR